MRRVQFPRCCKVYNIYDFGGDSDSYREEPSVRVLKKGLQTKEYNLRCRTSSNFAMIAIANDEQQNTIKALRSEGFIRKQTINNDWTRWDGEVSKKSVYIYIKSVDRK